MDDKIEEAASAYGTNNDYSVIGPDGRMSLKPELETAFETGAHYAINEFLKDLWHPVSEEPREKAMLLIEVSFPKPTLKKFYYVDLLIKEDWEIKCSVMSISRWLYVDDLISKI